MDIEDDLRGFIALTFPRAVTSALEASQRSLLQQAKEHNCRLKLLPKQTLSLPIEDLGAPPKESYEALELALRRSLSHQVRFPIELGPIDLWTPEGEGMPLLRALVTTGAGELASMRNHILRHLERYGFQVTPGQWSPHIPLAQILNGHFPMPDCQVALESPFEVRDVSVLCLTYARSGRSRFRIRKKHALNLNDQGILTMSTAGLSEAIADALDERIAGLPPSQTALSQKNRQRRFEEPGVNEDLSDDEESDASESEIVD